MCLRLVIQATCDVCRSHSRPGHTVQHCAQLESCSVCPPLKSLRATLRATVAELESVPTPATSRATVSPCVHHLQHRVQLRDAMFVLVEKKLACARLRYMLHQKLRTMLLGVATPVPKVARNDASCVRAFSARESLLCAQCYTLGLETRVPYIATDFTSVNTGCDTISCQTCHLTSQRTFCSFVTIIISNGGLFYLFLQEAKCLSTFWINPAAKQDLNTYEHWTTGIVS